MSGWRRMRGRFWNGATGREFRGDHVAQVIMAYLTTCDASHSSGLYRLAIPTLVHEIGSPFEGASKALRRVIDADYARYDFDAGVVFVVNMAREQVGESIVPTDKRRKGLIAHLEDMKDSPLLADWLKKYGEAYGIELEAPCKPLASPLQAPSKGIAHRDRDRDRDRDREREPSATPPPPGKPSSETSAPSKKKKRTAKISQADHGLAKVLIGEINRHLKRPPPKAFKVGKEAGRLAKRLRAKMLADEVLYADGQIEVPRLLAVLRYRCDKTDAEYQTPATLMNSKLLTDWLERHDNRPGNGSTLAERRKESDGKDRDHRGVREVDWDNL